MRIRASGVIVRDEEILVVEYMDPAVGWHYNLPGGGVEIGERVRDTVAREYMEETGMRVEPVDVLLIWEHMGEPNRRPMSVQTVGMVFRCDEADGQEPVMPETPDEFQIGFQRVALADLPDAPLLPSIGAEIVATLNAKRPRILLDEA